MVFTRIFSNEQIGCANYVAMTMSFAGVIMIVLSAESSAKEDEDEDE